MVEDKLDTTHFDEMQSLLSHTGKDFLSLVRPCTRSFLSVL